MTSIYWVMLGVIVAILATALLFHFAAQDFAKSMFQSL